MKNHPTLNAFLFGVFLASLCQQGNATPYQFDSDAIPQSPGSQSSTQLPEGLTSAPTGSIWTQDTLTGNWGGWRNKISEAGLSLSGNYQAEVFGNPVGGMKQGAISDGAFNFIANLDLERITHGFWQDAAIQANALYIYGPGLSGNYVGDFSNTSNISGPQSVRLQELWFQQLLWRERASVRMGMLAADTEFFTSTSSALFLNGTFGAFNLIGQNYPNSPVYPLSRPGVRVFIQPTSKFFVRAAVFGMDSNLDPSGNDLHGTDFKINGSLWMAEAGYLVNQSPNDRGLQGTYKIGTFLQNGFTTWQSQANEALGIGGLSSGSTQCAVYGIADQQVYNKEDRSISIFARGGFAPAQYSFVDGYLDAGFNFTGFVPNRPQDIAGIALAYSPVSGDYSNAQVVQGGSAYSKETVLEATYQIHLTPWCNIQPDVQYIITPSGQVGSPNALVVGIRSSINF